MYSSGPEKTRPYKKEKSLAKKALLSVFDTYNAAKEAEDYAAKSEEKYGTVEKATETRHLKEQKMARLKKSLGPLASDSDKGLIRGTPVSGPDYSSLEGRLASRGMWYDPKAKIWKHRGES